VLFDYFDMMMSKIKKKSKYIILMYFQAKNTFEKHHALQIPNTPKYMYLARL
jgi:hypothetical protein